MDTLYIQNFSFFITDFSTPNHAAKKCEKIENEISFLQKISKLFFSLFQMFGAKIQKSVERFFFQFLARKIQITEKY